MKHFVYMLISKKNSKVVTYVGYSINPKKRLIIHNNGKGAKFTRGRIWKLIFKKNLTNKSKALKFEYFLKKNIKLRNSIKNRYLNAYRSKR